MPKISTWSWRIDGKDVTFTIAYSLKDATFYANLPPWMAGVLNKQTIYGKTHREIELSLHEAVKEYGKRTRTEQKVIFYVFKSMVRPLNFEGDNEAHGLDEMCSEGVALDLWFRVGYIIKDPAESLEIYLTEKHEIPRSGGVFGAMKNRWVHYMPYTKEREQFFLAFRKYLVDGITTMNDFFKKETELPQLIDEMIRKRKALPFIPQPLK